MKINLRLYALSLLATVFMSCSTEKKQENSTPLIVCTTGIVADLVSNIVTDSVEIVSLMGPGVDPHLYKASAQDVKLLSAADVIVANGIHLEGKMTEILEQLSKTKKVILLGDSLPKSSLIQTDAFSNGYDPHIWFSASLWKQCGKVLITSLNKEGFTTTSAYLNQLDTLKVYVSNKLSEIAVNQRVLVTAHDAFQYYSKDYGIRIKALQGISTASDFGVKDVLNLANFVIENKVKAVFIETSIPPKSIKAVIEACSAKKFHLHKGKALYSDALGEANSPAGTYIGMVKTNTNNIVEALK